MATAERLLLVPLLGLPACISAAECDRRIQAAEIQALRDAEACAFDPAGLLHPDCGGSDHRPELTYDGVWCSTADLGCVTADTDAGVTCFGGPSTP